MSDFYLYGPLEREAEWPKEWPDWVRNALDKLERIERRFPLDVLKGAPRWVDNMSLRIIQMMHPATIICAEASGPALLGSTLGHLMWLIESENGLAAMVARLEEVAEKYERYCRTSCHRKTMKS